MRIRPIKKALINFGAIADAVFVVFLSYKLITYFISGQDILGVMFTMALGIWCISCKVGETAEKKED